MLLQGASDRALDLTSTREDATLEEAAMRRTLTVSILVMGLLALSLIGCGGAGSSITGPTLFERPAAVP